MRSTQFRLDPARVRDVERHVREKFGAAARIVSVDEVRLGGIGGFFAKRYLDVVVTFPRAEAEAVPPGVNGLLSRAEDLEASFPAAVGAPAGSAVSTQSDGFVALLAGLERSTGVRAEPALRGPRPPRTAPGALLAIVGLGDDAATVASAIAQDLPAVRLARCGSGGDPEWETVDSLARAERARHRAALDGAVLIVAIGLGAGGPAAEANVERVRRVAADAVWLAVDASRKHSDTVRWVAAVRQHAPDCELAVLGTSATRSPESVHELGLREVWSDTVR